MVGLNMVSESKPNQDAIIEEEAYMAAPSPSAS